MNLSLSYEKTKGSFTGEDVVAYIYAVLYSNRYRKENNDYLKYNFPVIPIPQSVEYFETMVDLGKQMINLHLPDNFYRDTTGSIVIKELNKFSYSNADKEI